MPYRLLVCGDRHWTDEKAIVRVLKHYHSDTVIIHGGAPGADTLAGQFGKRAGFEVIVFSAEWDKHGKAAGPIRNRRMLEEGKPNRVIAFHPDLRKSKGTADMLRQARAAGIDVEHYTGKE